MSTSAKLQLASVYKERNALVCLLSKIEPSYLARHLDSDTGWDEDWRWIVFICLPDGQQVCWHIHDSERADFNHLEVEDNNWDGHTTEQKYERISAQKKDWMDWREVMRQARNA